MDQRRNHHSTKVGCWSGVKKQETGSKNTCLETPLLPLSQSTVTILETLGCCDASRLAAKTAPTQFIADEQPTKSPAQHKQHQQIKARFLLSPFVDCDWFTYTAGEALQPHSPE